MPSFHKKKKLLDQEDNVGNYHVFMQRQKRKTNLRLPKIIDLDDAADVRQFLFEKAVKCFNDQNRNKMISFEINPKNIEPNVVGNENSGRFDMNRQRHFIATDYISKDTVIEEVESFKDWSSTYKKIQYPLPENGLTEIQEGIKWDHATYWHNNWLTSYNLFKDDEHIIGFALVSMDNGDGNSYAFVRPNDVVFDVANKKYLYFNENTYDATSNSSAPKAKLEVKKKDILELVA